MKTRATPSLDCARATPTLDRVIEEYGACVQVVWRNRPMPYHPHAALAARAATEVYAQRGDAAFWTYHDRLFARQDELSRALLEREAEALGLDMAAFAAARARSSAFLARMAAIRWPRGTSRGPSGVAS